MTASLLRKKGAIARVLDSKRRWIKQCFCACLFFTGTLAFAQNNAIQSVDAIQHGAKVIVKVALKNPIAKQPIAFSTSNPARVVVDFGSTVNATGVTLKEIGLGDIRSLNIVQAGERSRLVFNLSQAKDFATQIDGNVVTVTLGEASQIAKASKPAGIQIAKADKEALPALLRGIEFRRGSAGEGRVVVELPHDQISVDVRQEGQKLLIDFLDVGLPDAMRRRLDVTDFGTPVAKVETSQRGNNVQMLIEPQGLWEYSAYQSASQLVVDVKPIKEDPNKLTQGTQGYRGEKLSLNFQNVEVRAVLQVIADFTGLNIIASDTVGGNLTLRLKEVPWDQALDIVMRAKNLDMRKNGTVIWIAPKDELLTKEKLELEQKAQIAELEPMRMEVFQLNYQKAAAFKKVFNIDEEGGAGGNKRNSILSKRGSAVIDPRTNQLFVTDTPSKLEGIRRLVKKVDIPSRQVMIEARIVEADDNFSRNLGVKLGFHQASTKGMGIAGNKRIGITGNYLGIGEQTGQAEITDGSYIPNTQFLSLPAAAIGGNAAGSIGISLFTSAANRFLNLELSALEAEDRGKIVSSPRVVTADQQTAVIEQGEELPYQEATSSGATSISWRKASLRLEVTPQITPDGNVILDVDVNKDSVGRNTVAGFAIDTKHVKTQVLVENGGTVVLGGIFLHTKSDVVTQVPLLGDIPLVGHLFKNKERKNNKTELLIFITPKIITEGLAKQ